MKKFRLLIFLILMIIPVGILCSCGYELENGEQDKSEIESHTHDFYINYFDENGTFDLCYCGEKENIVEHQMENYECINCGYQAYEKNLVFTLLSNNSGYSVKVNNRNIKKTAIPSVYNDKPVVEISKYGFAGCNELIEISIPSSIKKINANAFEFCFSLERVIIPEGVEKIEDRAFAVCPELTTVSIPNSLKKMGDGVFTMDDPALATPVYDKKYYNIFPEGKYLGNYENPYLIFIDVSDKNVTTFEINSKTKFISGAFFECTSLTSINIPEGILGFCDGAFMYCIKLTSIEIANSVTSIGEGAFFKCTSLTSINIPETVTYIGATAFYGCISLTSIEIPYGVTSIEHSTFMDCSSLMYIYLPDTITRIESGAFRDCINLITLVIPAGITSMDAKDTPFFNCNSLETIFNDSEMRLTPGKYGILPTTKIYNKGEWSYINGVPTPNK